MKLNRKGGQPLFAHSVLSPTPGYGGAVALGHPVFAPLALPWDAIFL